MMQQRRDASLTVVLDLLGAPVHSGGMRLHAEEMVNAWASQYPLDRLVVVGNPWVRTAFRRWSNVRFKVLPEGIWSRVLGQVLLVAWVARRERADAIHSVSPLVTPLAASSGRFCTVHDWRHLKRPDEFGSMQRSYRRLWTWSVASAAVAFQVSEKTSHETAVYVPTARRLTAENGRDHPRRWRLVERQIDEPPHVVTFGHHTNKRPEAVIVAFARLVAAGDCDPALRLVILGARGAYAEQLANIAASRGVRERVDFPGFVDQATYQRLIQTASVIVLASSDEGFGLPVAEGNYFGIPVVGTVDGGLDSIHPGRVAVAPLENLHETLQTALDDRLQMAHSTTTWATTSNTIRNCIAGHVFGSLGR